MADTSFSFTVVCVCRQRLSIFADLAVIVSMVIVVVVMNAVVVVGVVVGVFAVGHD